MAACFRTETAWIPHRMQNAKLVHTEPGAEAVHALKTITKGEKGPDHTILSIGFCGGLAADLRPGELILAEKISYRNEEIRLDPGLLQQAKAALSAVRLRPVLGRQACAERTVTTVEEKQALQETGTIAVDMESGPLARFAASIGAGFLSLRAILDSADLELPLTERGLFIHSLLLHPALALRLPLLALIAGRALGRAVPTVVNGLGGR